MGWYSQKYFQPSASLVRLAGNGIGSGLSAVGKTLINLGNDKVAQARQKALENEKRAKLQAQAEYNMAVNPELAKRIDKDKLGHVALSPVKLPKLSKTVKLKDGTMAEVYDDGSVKRTGAALYNEPKQVLQGAAAIDPVTGKIIYKNKKPIKPTIKNAIGKDGKPHVYQFDGNNNVWRDTGLIPLSKNGGVKAPVSVNFGGLSLPEKMYVSTHPYLLNGNRVNYSQLKNEMRNRKRPDKNFGNIEVR